LLFKGYKDRYNRKCLTHPLQFRKSNLNPIGEEDRVPIPNAMLALPNILGARC